jgi:hypothetical protein
VNSDRPRAALILLLAATAACPNSAQQSAGASLLITFERTEGTPPAEYLLLTSVGGGNVYAENQRAPLEGSLPDGPVLGTFQLAVREAGARTIVARGFFGENQVSQGAVHIVAAADTATRVTLKLYSAPFDDNDGDGIPDLVDNCPTEPNKGQQEPCLSDAGVPVMADAGADSEGADLARDTAPPPPDLRLPDTAVPPDVAPGKSPRGRACLNNDECDSAHCVDSRVGRFCASAGMAVVPAGPFMRGCLARDTQCQADEQPLRTIMLGGFEIDQTEVVQSQYDACVKAGACPAPSGFNPGARPSHPVTNTSWAMASMYCSWAGKRLPTEAEWEKAARGPNSNVYPWGDQAPDCSHAQYKGCGLADSVPVGQLAGTSGYGVEDLAGNAAEWVNDFYAAGYYASAPTTDPPGPTSGMHVRRGGGFSSDPPMLRTGARASGDAAVASAGFRCARSF